MVRVLTCEVLPTAPESRTKYELQRGAEQEADAEGDGGGFRKDTYMMVHF